MIKAIIFCSCLNTQFLSERWHVGAVELWWLPSFYIFFFSFFYVVTVPAVVGLMAFVFLSWLGLFLLFQCICYDPFFFFKLANATPLPYPPKKN